MPTLRAAWGLSNAVLLLIVLFLPFFCAHRHDLVL
eukprot:COSAG02_NODE_61315_length_269_cov_0.588235_1_plen_34_part_10